VYCDCAVGSACPVDGSSCTCCSVAGAITGFGALELEKGHMMDGWMYVWKDVGLRSDVDCRVLAVQ
jgi:hypothetical protein